MKSLYYLLLLFLFVGCTDSNTAQVEQEQTHTIEEQTETVQEEVEDTSDESEKVENPIILQLLSELPRISPPIELDDSFSGIESPVFIDLDQAQNYIPEPKINENTQVITALAIVEKVANTNAIIYFQENAVDREDEQDNYYYLVVYDEVGQAIDQLTISDGASGFADDQSYITRTNEIVQFTLEETEQFYLTGSVHTFEEGQFKMVRSLDENFETPEITGEFIDILIKK
ncbi:MAG: hypothetical protein AAFO07_28590 [Bacteroidota bacterium]